MLKINKNKKIVLLALLGAAVHSVSAQFVKFGIKAGAVLTKIRAEDSRGNHSTSDERTGLTFGAFANFKFGPVSLQHGLSYVTKGGKESVSTVIFGTQTASTKTNAKIEYLELPINVLYYVPVGLGNFYFGAGPYVAYGISGQMKVESTFNNQTDTDKGDVEFGDNDGEIKPLDYGLNGLTGLKFKNRLDLGINYALGLGNMSNSNSSKAKNRAIGFTIGYTFK